jgi:hypothetical protein
VLAVSGKAHAGWAVPYLVGTLLCCVRRLHAATLLSWRRGGRSLPLYVCSQRGSARAEALTYLWVPCDVSCVGLVIVVPSWRNVATVVCWQSVWKRTGGGTHVPVGTLRRLVCGPRHRRGVVAGGRYRRVLAVSGKARGCGSHAPSKNPATPCARASCRLIVVASASCTSLLLQLRLRCLVVVMEGASVLILSASCAGLSVEKRA